MCSGMFRSFDMNSYVAYIQKDTGDCSIWSLYYFVKFQIL